jgi:predicted negative regulator of RcsB-dependent stress response
MAEELLTDDEQWEAIKRWTSENGVWLLGGVALGAALLFGFRFYQNHRNNDALSAAAQFDAMTAAFDTSDRAAARRAGEALVKAYPATPYADQAELILARLAIDDGQPATAVERLTHVMNGSKDTELQKVARLRLARVQVDQGKPDEAIATLGVGDPGKFQGAYHDVRGDALFAKKDLAGAAREYQAALDAGDAKTPERPLIELKLADLGKAATPAARQVTPPAKQATP